MSIASLRDAAATAQEGKCYYCDFPMWDPSLENLRTYAARHQLSPGEARHFECTSRHVVPKSLGGKDEPANVVAACKWCNMRLRYARPMPAPANRRFRVRSRPSQRSSHATSVRAALSLA